MILAGDAMTGTSRDGEDVMEDAVFPACPVFPETLPTTLPAQLQVPPAAWVSIPKVFLRKTILMRPRFSVRSTKIFCRRISKAATSPFSWAALKLTSARRISREKQLSTLLKLWVALKLLFRQTGKSGVS